MATLRQLQATYRKNAQERRRPRSDQKVITDTSLTPSFSANGTRSTFTHKQPAHVSKSVAVAPIDTIILGMEKPLSGNIDYESVINPQLEVDQQGNQWPADMTSTEFPPEFRQVAPLLSSTNADFNNNAQYQPQDVSKFRRPQQGRLMHHKLQNESIEVERDTTPTLRPVTETIDKKRPQISNAPQTKVQQQRQALRQRPRNVSDEIDELPIPEELERLVLRILKRSTRADEGTAERQERGDVPARRFSPDERTSTPLLTKGETIKASKMISNFLEQSIQARIPSSSVNANAKICVLCGHRVARVCDLKKHMKRHERPYGCTYPKCTKRFGAKSDWKRHENSQHFQLEAFRCGQMSIQGTACGEHFFHLESFQRHLENQHKLSEDEWDKEVEARRIGKNCQQQFWCGFHGDIIKLKEVSNAAWDERFDHIAHHFEKEKLSIDMWLCAELNKPKKDLVKEMDERYASDEEEERSTDASEETDNIPQSVPVHAPHLTVTGPLEVPNSKKRGCSTDTISAPKQKKHRTRYRASGTEFRFCVSTIDPA